MSTWKQAHISANLAAAQAHADLGVNPHRYPVDVYGAISAADVELMWRPLPRAFGLYLNNPGCPPGILINNRIPRAAQRQTAGHELGHHHFDHGSRVDNDLNLFDEVRRGWTEPEKAAEAFAAWFLMPRRAVRAAMSMLALPDIRTAEQVYQLSLLLGTPYRSTARHLPNLRLASTASSQAWMKVQPTRLKDRLDPGVAPGSRNADVWRVDRGFDGSEITASPGDRLVLALDAGEVVHVTSGSAVAPVRVVPLRTNGRAPRTAAWRPSNSTVVIEIATDATPDVELLDIRLGELVGASGWDVRVHVERTRCGLARHIEAPFVEMSHTITISTEEGTFR